MLTEETRAALLYVLWHHQGGSSNIGQPIRLMLGLGQHEHLSPRQVDQAQRVSIGPRDASPATAPADIELLDLAADYRSQYCHGMQTFDELDAVGFARAVLARYAAPAPAVAAETLAQQWADEIKAGRRCGQHHLAMPCEWCADIAAGNA